MELRFAIVGPGSVGTVLKYSLASAGYEITSVRGRGDSLSDLPHPTTAVAICTPDDAVARVANDLIGAFSDWRGRIAFHVSGALTSEILAPLATAGALTVSFHPLSTYPPDGGRRDLAGTTVALEGMPDAVSALEEVALRLGASPVRISADQKAAYHLAASIASNYLVTLHAAVEAVLDAADLDPHLMDGLVADTISNLRAKSADEALTGPIARGDAATVSLHLQTLGRIAPDQLPFYRALAKATLDLAAKAGRIDAARHAQLLQMLAESDA